ncbi:hypothetical protein [Elongatibacter sediminis]|uniref:Phosphate acetyltransferase n=1 Tax=Elongatibacter sediminis TaxID=3119006 RepID=A0AAW9RBC5_9GAMM
MKIGDQARLQRAFSPADVTDYRAVSGHEVKRDGNRAEDVPEVVPEPLIGALFSCLLGMHLPGMGTKYLKQETRFHGEARAGETLTAEVRITRIRPDKHLVDLETSCTGADGRSIASGRALVHVSDVTDVTGPAPGKNDD